MTLRQGLPFAVRIPNAETLEAIRQARTGMHGVLRRRQHTQIKNRAALSVQENDSAEIPVSGDEQAVLRAGDFKQFLVRGP